MNEAKSKAFLTYLEEKTAACNTEAAALDLDHRRDEAVFAKIRLNVYDIFKTVFSVISAGKDSSQASLRFLEKLNQIPRNWQTSLELAQQHGNSEKAHIEQIKLDTAAEIRSTFETIREADL